MKSFTEYNPTTGEITRVITQNDDFTPRANLDFIEGSYDDLEYKIINRTPIRVYTEPTPVDHWALLRVERNHRLATSDWTQVADAPVDRAAWAAYRQALRELPGNTVDPLNPVWPVPPVS